MRINFYPKILFLLLLFVFSCSIEKKAFDNPVDIAGDQAPDPPYLSFFPKLQTTSVAAICSVGAYIVLDSTHAPPVYTLSAVFVESHQSWPASGVDGAEE